MNQQTKDLLSEINSTALATAMTDEWRDYNQLNNLIDILAQLLIEQRKTNELLEHLKINTNIM